MKENNYIVYKHTSPSNKVYIGITSIELKKRWCSGKGYPHNKYFTSAINKYGWGNFKHEILFENLTKEEACQKEIELIAYYKSNDREFGYNQSIGGEAHSGCKHSPEAKRKIGEANSIIKRTKETREKIAKANLGTKKSEKTRKKMSDSHKDKKLTEEHCQKIIEGRQRQSQAYKEYKANGGLLKWNEYLKEQKNEIEKG